MKARTIKPNTNLLGFCGFFTGLGHRSAGPQTSNLGVGGSNPSERANDYNGLVGTEARVAAER
jgi:hypothetical protein